MTRKKNRRARRPSTQRPASHSPTARPELLPLVLAAVVFLAVCLYFMPFTPDDSYISYRYAENLARGYGLTFNIGTAPVEAYSNLLWILVLALVHAMGLGVPAVAPWLGVGLGLVGLVLLWRLCLRSTGHPNQLYLPLLLYATSGPFALYAVSGMESALFAVLLLLLVLRAQAFPERRGVSAVVSLTATGLALAITRPEGVIVLPAALGVIAWTGRRSPDRRVLRDAGITVAAFTLLFVAYNVWRIGYFGEWLPTPFMSKGGEGASLLAGWTRNLQRYFVNWSYYSPPWGYYFLGLFGGAVAGVTVRDRARAGTLPLVVAVLLAAVYFNFVDWMPAMRYHAALVPLLLVPLASLQCVIPEDRWTLSTRAAQTRGSIALVIVVLLSGLGLNHLKISSAAMSESMREALAPLGDWLRGTVSPSAWLAMSDVGAIPYISGLRTIDIHTESLTDLHIARGEFTAEYVLRKEPTVVALAVRGLQSARMDLLHYSLYKNEEFNANYQFIGTVRHRWYQERAYWVFIRGGSHVDTDQLDRLPIGVGNLHISNYERIGSNPR